MIILKSKIFKKIYYQCRPILIGLLHSCESSYNVMSLEWNLNPHNAEIFYINHGDQRVISNLKSS